MQRNLPQCGPARAWPNARSRRLGRDPALAGNAGRVARVAEIDAAIGAWTGSRQVAHVLAALHDAQVPAGRIYTAKDIAEDPHYRARGMIQSVATVDGLTVDVPGIVPKLSATPGAIRRRAPALGEDTDAVLREIGVSPEQVAALRARGVI